MTDAASWCRAMWANLQQLGGDHVYRHVRTLVLDLDDLLVHSDWTRARGWRTFKRPGVEDFLKTIAPKWEVCRLYAPAAKLLNLHPTT